VPSDWVKPAEGGVERLLNVYVSMGVTPPVSVPTVIESSAVKAATKPRAPKTPKPLQ
jgi:uncharacterized membrane protein